VIRRHGGDHPFARHPAVLVALVTVVVGLPLLVALADLRTQNWHPVLDLAMTEFRVRDVGGPDTPLIGLPGRIAPGPEQGSHPGPLSFYLLAPVYRLLGSTSWALEVATVAVHLAAIATVLAIAHRRAGWHGVVAAGALVAVVIRGYGQILLTQPWNPYLPLLAWIVVLVATWAVVVGDEWMLVPLVVAASLCAQTHVPYVGPAGGLTVGAIALVAWRGQARPGGRLLGRRVVVPLVIGGLLWLPPFVEEVVNESGNLGKLSRHFGSPLEEPLGLADGGALALRHLDVWAGFVGQFADTGRFVSPSSTGRGAATLAVWLVAAGWTWRRGPSALRSLHVVVGAALLLGAFAMTRIFGLPWYYLTLWAWGTSAMALGAVVWTAATAWPTGVRWSRRPDTRRTSEPRRAGWSPVASLPVGALAVGLVATVSSTVSFADADVPERRLSDAVEALADPTYEAVMAGVGAAAGPDATYRVRWSDAADIGSPGFGLLDELERMGLDVTADPYFHIPATERRTRDGSTEAAQIHLATARRSRQWRRLPLAVEVATYEPRDARARAVYERTRQRLVDRLRAERLEELVATVDQNLFGGSLDPRLSAADIADFTTLLDLGQPMAVFVAPAGVDPPR